MGKKLTDEFLKWTLDIDGKPAMAALNSMEQQTKLLRNANQALYNEMVKLESQGKKNSDEYKALDKQYKENNTTISLSRERMAELRKEIGLNGLTATQLNQRMKELKRSVDSSVPNSDVWKQHKKELTEVKSRYDQVKSSAGATNSVFGQLKGLLPMIGWAALAGAAVTAFTKIKDSTHATADAFEFEMAGMKSAIDYFWRALATGDWTNFFDGFKKAAAAGRDYAKQLDEVADNTRALRIIESNARTEELRLEKILKSKLASPEERIKAGKDRVALEEKLSKDRQIIANKNYDAEIKEGTRITKLNEQQLLSVAGVIDSETKARAVAYQAKVDDYNKMKAKNIIPIGSSTLGMAETVTLSDTPKMKALKAEIDATEGLVKDYATFMKSYDVATEGQQDKIVSALEAKNTAINSVDENLKKVQVRVDSLLAGEEVDGEKLKAKAVKDTKEDHDLAFRALEISNQKDLNLIKKHQLEVNDTEENYNKALEKEEINALNKKLALQLKYGDDTTDTMAAILDKQLKAQQDINKKNAEEKKESYKKDLGDLENTEKNELAQVKKNALAKGLTEEETNALLIAKEIEFLNNKLALQKKYGEDTAETTAAIAEKINALAENALKGDEDRLKELADLKKKYLGDEVNAKIERDAALAELDKIQKAGLIKSEEEYQQLKAGINKKYDDDKLGDAIKLAEKISKVVSMGSNLVQTLMDAELAKAGDNEEKKAQIRKKYANAQFMMAAAEIVINTAVAIMQGFAQLGPIGGAIAAVLIGATGVAQLAIANAERKKMQGKQSGGYADSSTSDADPAGVYHANEFIASAPAVRNPTVKPILDIIDIAQRTGTIKQLNLQSIILDGGKQVGGYANSGSSSTSHMSNSITGGDELLSTLKKLNTHLDNGIKAKSVINKYGTNSLSEAMDDIAKFRSKIYRK